MNRINFDSVIMSHIYIYVYAYDKGGNRETEKIYAFTTGDTLGEVLETKTSQYNYLVWKDRLSSYGGKTVKYDSAGNPTSYDGKTYKWDGRNLKEIALADGSKTQFEYDQDGLRTQKRQYKTDGGLDYFVDYIWEDGKLTYQYLTLAVYITDKNGVTTMREFGPITVKIIYDDSGLPQGFMVNDSAEYAFVRNLQGDVIAMIDQNGETVMEYSYDPWGKIEYHLSDTIEDEETAKLITALCPLTYRGYNYDFTTGLYYLQSRYYNPEWGRFLNCDDTNILLATQGETHNANLFAYCDNNPVNRVDYTGYECEELVAIVVKIICIASIISPFYEKNSKELYVAVRKEENNEKLGQIRIRLKDRAFSNAIYTCCQIDEQITSNLLALIAFEKFEKFIHREFLFSESCVTAEIKWHLDKYICSLIYYDGINNGVLTPGPIDSFVYYYLYKHCVDIDIVESDVYVKKQATTFDYYNGINDCYKYTLADPYMNNGVRKKVSKVSQSKTDWINHLMERGGV